MKFPIKITKNQIENQWLAEVVDLPGCQLKDASIDKALDEIKKVIADHLAILAEYGEPIPNATTIEHQLALNSSSDATWAVVDFDINPYLGKSHKINVTLPELLIKQIDDRVSKSELHKTRSGFIATACMKLLNQ